MFTFGNSCHDFYFTILLGNTPKYGLIFHSSFIGRAGAKNKGRISRYLANKCSIASRIDCFMENSTNIFGSKLVTNHLFYLVLQKEIQLFDI